MKDNNSNSTEAQQSLVREVNSCFANSLREVYLSCLEKEDYNYLLEMRKILIKTAKRLGVDYSDIARPIKPVKVPAQYSIPHCRDCIKCTSKGSCVEILIQYGFRGGFGKRCSTNCSLFVPKSEIAYRYKDVMKKIEENLFENH